MDKQTNKKPVPSEILNIILILLAIIGGLATVVSCVLAFLTFIYPSVVHRWILEIYPPAAPEPQVQIVVATVTTAEKLPTYTLYPTYTLVPTILPPTPSPIIKVVTATSLPPPTPPENTPPGTHLKPEETWKQGDVYLTLKNVSKPTGQVFLSFDIANHVGSDLTVSLDLRDVTVETNTGIKFQYWTSNPDGSIWQQTIANGDRVDVMFHGRSFYWWNGDYYPNDVSYILVTVRNWSRIQEAIWEIPITH